MQVNKIKIKKQVDVLEIFPSMVDEYWSLVEFMLREGLKYDGNPMNIEDLKEGIEQGAYQLFMMFGSDDGDKYKVFGVFVTRIMILPNYSGHNEKQNNSSKNCRTISLNKVFQRFMPVKSYVIL